MAEAVAALISVTKQTYSQTIKQKAEMNTKNNHHFSNGIKSPEEDHKSRVVDTQDTKMINPPTALQSSSSEPPPGKSSKMTTPEQKKKLDHDHDVMAAAAVTSAIAGMAVGGPIVSLAAGAAAAELATHEDGAIGGFCRATGQFVIDALDWLDTTTRRMCHDCMS